MVKCMHKISISVNPKVGYIVGGKCRLQFRYYKDSGWAKWDIDPKTEYFEVTFGGASTSTSVVINWADKQYITPVDID